MTEKQVNIGFDRFLAREWADYALELFLSSDKEIDNYQLLKSYLQREISGVESARKSSNQLKRLWLNDHDEYEDLRLDAGHILRQQQFIDSSIFHFGLSINVFPIFKEVCKKLGELSKLQPIVNKRTLISRVSQTFLNPSSTPRIVSRVVQTLESWKFVKVDHGSILLIEIVIDDKNICNWFVKSQMNAISKTEIPLNSVNILPEKLGVIISNIRSHILQSEKLTIRRNMDGEESISVKVT